MLSLPKYTFRINFPYTGNYSILLVDNVNDKSLASTTFEIKLLATILGNYLFGQGIGFLFAALGPIITIFLERVSKMHDERTKILESKSRYMIEHIKEHGNLEVRSKIICSIFQNGPNNKTFNHSYNVDSAKLLTNLLRYWLAYHIFLRKAGGFYFDNYRAELLAFDLSRDIRIQITDEIFYGLNFENYAELRKEHEEKDTVKTIDEDEDNIYRMALSSWLVNKREDVKRFYKNFLLFHSIINLGLNTALTVTYSSWAGIMKDLKAEVESEPEINEYLRSIQGDDSADIFDLFPQFSKWNRFS
jgi:hypothetical protein